MRKLIVLVTILASGYLGILGYSFTSVPVLAQGASAAPVAQIHPYGLCNGNPMPC